tara:strand:- start:150 stop:581 length:432 start_codon:yes stop_codon:yes gene_type:complete
MRANMQKELATVIKTLTANGCTVEETDTNMYNVTVQLGNGFAGDYKGGYWGDCAITDDTLELNFLVGDIYGEQEIACGEGFVHLNYKGGCAANGLAYTGALDKLVCERIASATNGVVEASSSEQGMQGHYDETESYLSLDVYV